MILLKGLYGYILPSCSVPIGPWQVHCLPLIGLPLGRITIYVVVKLNLLSVVSETYFIGGGGKGIGVLYRIDLKDEFLPDRITGTSIDDIGQDWTLRRTRG